MINEIGEPAMLEMLAEELVECAHEVLKLARVLRCENPTPKTEKEVRASLREEWSDVVQCSKELNLDVNWIAYRSGTYFEKGWLQNKLKRSESSFCAVKDNGNSDDWPAVFFRGVRPVFLIGKKIKKVE